MPEKMLSFKSHDVTVFCCGKTDVNQIFSLKEFTQTLVNVRNRDVYKTWTRVHGPPRGPPLSFESKVNRNMKKTHVLIVSQTLRVCLSNLKV